MGQACLELFFAPWDAGATIMAYGYPRFDIDTLLHMLVQHPITSLCAPPTVWRLLRQKSLQDYLVSLRQGLSAGEPLNPEVSADIEKVWKILIREGYGQTETTALIAYCLGQTVTRGAMGCPLPSYRLKIIDEKGNTANEGQLAVECNPEKPVGVMEGYSDSGKTNEVMQGGVYRTGDRVRRENGLLFFVGRDDDVFKCSGYRISPFELESILLEHPAVLEAAVVPKPDAIKGAIPKAFIVLRGKHDSAIVNEIDSFQKKKIAPSHRILAIEICDTLPKTSSGKIIRAELRAREKAIYEQNEKNANKTYTR